MGTTTTGLLSIVLLEPTALAPISVDLAAVKLPPTTRIAEDVEGS